jgi:hypothetical protein
MGSELDLRELFVRDFYPSGIGPPVQGRFDPQAGLRRGGTLLACPAVLYSRKVIS